MKLLFLSGYDGVILEFKHFFKGWTVSDIIEDLELCMKEFFEKYPEYKNDCDYYVKEMNIDGAALEKIKSTLCFDDILQSTNIFSADSII